MSEHYSGSSPMPKYAYASKLIPTPVPVQKVTDYTLLDEVLRERK
jgi:hypothetical protein